MPCSVVFRAVQANNINVVQKLVEEFNASPYVNDPVSGETALHIACQMSSELRFYIVQNFPLLAQIMDASGNLALHIACRRNDYSFVAWLFSSIVNDDMYADIGSPTGLPRSLSLPHLQPVKPYPRQHSSQSLVSTQPLFCKSRPQQKKQRIGRSKKAGVNPPEQSNELDSCTQEEVCIQNGSLPADTPAIPVDRPKVEFPNDGTSLWSIGEEEPDERQFELVSSVQSARTSSFVSSGASEISDSSIVRVEDAELLSSQEVDNTGEDHRKPPLNLQHIIDLKPFRLTAVGESVLHILAHEGHSRLLDLMLKVARFFEYNFQECKVDLTILTQRNSFTQHTPLEEAITNKHVYCLELLIKFAVDIRVIWEIVQDSKLLNLAVLTKDIEIVQALIRFGFCKGLEQAISLAYVRKAKDILRLLLYFHTQVENALEFSRVRRNRTVVLDTGGIKWVGLQLEHVQPIWLDDSYHAVDCVAKAFKLTTIVDSAATKHKFFCQLGDACLKYYREFMTLQSISATTVIAHNLIPIVEVNLSENQLTMLPRELFQMQSLRTLKLMHNALRELPSTGNPRKSLYTAPHLKVLCLDSNHLETLPEELFCGLAFSLEELSVTHNELRDLPPGVWVAPKLKTLRLGHNRLKRLHHLSSPRFFSSHELSQRVVSCFSVTDGVLEVQDPSGKEGSQGILELENYIHNLEAFCHTVHRVMDAADSLLFGDILQMVIDVHWMRYNQHQVPNSQPPGEDDGFPVEEWLGVEGVTEQDEENQEKSLLQTNSSKLGFLDLSENEFDKLPWDLPCLAPNLQRLDLRCNRIREIDIVHSIPVNISTLFLDWNKIQTVLRPRQPSLPCGNPVLLLSAQPERTERYCDHSKHRYLDNLSNLTMDHNMLREFPVVEVFEKSIRTEETTFGKVSYQPYYPNLSILSLEENQLSELPSNLHQLTHLSSLTLSHNPIGELPLEFGLMNAQALLVLKLEGVYIRNISPSLLEKPTPKHLISYLKSMLQKSRPYRRIKLMVVGEANKGKTSLLLNLTKRGRVVPFKPVRLGYNGLPLSTVGVDLGDWEYSPARGKDKVTFMTWDFGGQVRRQIRRTKPKEL